MQRGIYANQRTVLKVRRPEGKVISQELHDQRAVLVGLLAERVELGNGVVKRLLSEVARTVGRVEDLVVEHREVEGQTETNGVSGRKLGLGNVGGSLVGVVGLVGSLLLLVADSELGEVAVVVALPANVQNQGTSEIRLAKSKIRNGPQTHIL